MTQASLSDLTRTFARIGILSFGGPAAQIALMHRELVDEKQWVSEKEYLSALSFCMLLPGPEAMQLATWFGWRTHGTLGGLIAGALFVLPGALIVLVLSMIYASWGALPLVAALFTGVQAAVLAVVIEALLRVSKRALKTRAHWIIAALAFAALFLFAAPFPVVILAAALWGFVSTSAPHSPNPSAAPWRQSLQAAAVWGAVWLLPLLLITQFAPAILADIALFFSKLALLTFGGAYAVLTWMAQDVVQQKQWLTLPQMMDGLGLAETTPGPLILVTEFVGYLAAAKQGVWMGLAGAAITLWMTFAPCFLWIFAGAPWLARLTTAPRLAGALHGITAAVVGVIANLSLWFAAHVLFATVTPFSAGPLQLILPDPSSLRLLPTALALLAAYLLLRRHWPLPYVLAISAAVTAALAAF
ncbi:MAG: chromate efflux transporter [Cypionkella sp.]|uniref:chromate efflux transporter n=1 Tax=Cypionkella sp. TaxID=2811411 RepID=UPI00271C71A5|nr:chromate efflux transporter [Cypionkella sp.]MDO8327094.1 chromate efflux transporter [Cypionkella sp.]